MKKQTTLLVLVASLFATMIVPAVSAVTEEEAKAIGAGFHEPSEDWWDNEYKYRIEMNFSAPSIRDTNFSMATVDFADYFATSDGIVDLASMQLVKVLPNQSSLPVTYQAETDAVDIWNPPTIPEIEGALIGSVLEENGTFIGTVFNSIEGSGLISQSIRFQADLDIARDNVTFQFVHQPEFERNVSDDSYIEIYAGVPGDWGTPVRVFRRDLPDEKGWTNYITLPLESTMSGLVWINMEAPTLYGAASESFFSIDFVFVDGEGFNKRKVTHFVPELSGVGDVTQEVYYPRVQVLEREQPRPCTIYSAEPFDGTDKYFLYFNLMDDSNGRVIDNEAVRFIGELDVPQRFDLYENEFGFITVDRDDEDIEPEAFLEAGINSTETWGTFLNFSINETDSGYDFKKEFGTIFTRVTLKNGTTSVTYTAYKDADFLDIEVKTSIALNVSSNITDQLANITLNHVANDTGWGQLNNSNDDDGFTSDYVAFFDNKTKTYLSIASNETISYEIEIVDEWGNASVYFDVQDDAKFKVRVVNSSVIHEINQDIINDEMADAYVLYGNRLATDVTVDVDDEVDLFAPLQLFLISNLPTLAVVGDGLSFGLFGHNLQSMSVNIDNVTSDAGINGSYVIDLSGRNRGLFEKRNTIVVTGRNEFGETVVLDVTLWIASSVFDIPFTVIIVLFNSVFGFIGTVIAIIFPAVIVKEKKQRKLRKNCPEGGKCDL